MIRWTGNEPPPQDDGLLVGLFVALTFTITAVGVVWQLVRS